MPERQVTSIALELTRRCFAAGNSGDFDALMEFLGPDSVWDVSPWGLGSHTGPASIRAFFEDWIGSFAGYELELEELVDLGSGIVLTVATQRGLPAGGGARVLIRWAAVFIWAEHKIVRATHYASMDDARAAAERLAASRG
jgi:ketosteroid isomerase-like protein